jgi:hypothetical protein
MAEKASFFTPSPFGGSWGWGLGVFIRLTLKYFGCGDKSRYIPQTPLLLEGVATLYALQHDQLQLMGFHLLCLRLANRGV